MAACPYFLHTYAENLELRTTSTMPSPDMLLQSSPMAGSFFLAHSVSNIDQAFDFDMSNFDVGSSPFDAFFQPMSGAQVDDAEQSIDGMQLVETECAEYAMQKAPPPSTDHEAQQPLTGLGEVDVYADNESSAVVRQIAAQKNTRVSRQYTVWPKADNDILCVITNTQW